MDMRNKNYHKERLNYLTLDDVYSKDIPRIGQYLPAEI